MVEAKRSGRTVTDGKVTPDAVREYDETMTEGVAKLAKHWFPDMKIVAHKFGEKIKRGVHVLERRTKGNFNDLPSAAEIKQIEASDRKHPSLFGAQRILLTKGETAIIYNELHDHGFVGKERYGDEQDLFSAYRHETDPRTGAVKTTVYACEYLGDHFFKPYAKRILDGELSEADVIKAYEQIKHKFTDGAGEAGYRYENSRGDMGIDGRKPERNGNDNGTVAVNGNGDKAPGARGNDKGNSSLPDAGNATAENGEVSYLRDTSGNVLGWFDPNSKEVHLLPGADPQTVAHEIMWHGTRDYITRLAAKGDKQAQKFLDMMHDVEKNIPEELKQKIIATYTKGAKAPSSDTLMNEFGAWFTMEKGGAALEKALQSAEGRNWFAKALYTVKEMYKSFLRKRGGYCVDLSAINGMTREEFVDFIAKEFASGKTLGNITDKGNELSTKETKFQAWRRKTYYNNAPVRDLERDIEKNDPNVVVFKDGGRAYAIRLNGTRGAAITNAVGGGSVSDGGVWLVRGTSHIAISDGEGVWCGSVGARVRGIAGLRGGRGGVEARGEAMRHEP